MTETWCFSVTDLSNVNYADLSNEIRRRDINAEQARKERQYEEYKARQEQYKLEDEEFCASIGITYEQYESAWIHYDDVSEHRY